MSKKRIDSCLKVVLIGALLFVMSCANSSSSSDKNEKDKKKNTNTKTTENGYTLDHDDGNPIAMFLSEDMSTKYDETVRFCFYEDGTVKLRATSLEDRDKCYGVRYNKARGKYSGDPTKDGTIVIDFVEYVPNSSWSSEGFYYHEYDGEPDKEFKIENDSIYFYDSKIGSGNFVRNTADDLGPYYFYGVKRRRSDNRISEWTVPEGYSSVGQWGVF